MNNEHFYRLLKKWRFYLLLNKQPLTSRIHGSTHVDTTWLSGNVGLTPRAGEWIERVSTYWADVASEVPVLVRKNAQ